MSALRVRRTQISVRSAQAHWRPQRYRRQVVELAYKGHRPASPVGTSKFETATKAEKRSIKAGFPPWLPAIVSLKTLSGTGAPSCLSPFQVHAGMVVNQEVRDVRRACLVPVSPVCFKKRFRFGLHLLFFRPRKVRLVHGCSGLEFKGKSPRSACFGFRRSLGGVVMLRR